MVKDKLILMADIIDSRHADQKGLMDDFAEVVREVNISLKKAFLSPLTITLGDEFQGVMSGLKATIPAIIALEETIINTGKRFKLRYVVVEGTIDTPINKEIAYGMMGDGLTRARRQLENLKKSDNRFYFNLNNKPKQEAINNLFIALQTIIDDWNAERDYYIVAAFLQNNDYKLVASALKKERSLMWKRQKGLKIDAYNALKEVANFIGRDTNA